jgi:acyl-CoA synthetase (AMP-forming)/AMP-acid ligase II
VSAISSRSHAAAFAAGSVGPALPGLELRVNDEGRLFVRGPSVMLGYADDPAATRAVLDDAGWLETGDVGRLDGHGNLFVEGRRDGVVKCAGERVSVEEIAAVLRRADGVRDAHVLAAPHPETGVSLWAFVECAGVPEQVARLRAFLRAELSPAKRPAHVVAVDALPRGPNGKVAAQELHARIQAKKRERDDAA